MRRKRMAVFLAAVCLLLAVCPGVQAAEDVFFVAVNDTIPLTLTGVAPYYSSGGLLVPYTVFDAAPGGVASAYNAGEQTFVLFTREHRLIFDLSAQTVTDEKSNESETAVSYRGGVLYVPLGLCAQHFGLTTSMLTSADGYTVLRFTTGSEVYEDSLFIEKAENLIAYRIAQLSQPPTTEQPAEPPGPAAPETPPDIETPPETPPAMCYLAITGAETMQQAADALQQLQLRAAFFLTAGEIQENEALVRALFVAGHTIGLRPEPETDDIDASLRAANDALDAALHRKSVLALLDAGQTAAGYRVISAEQAPNGVSIPAGEIWVLAAGADAQEKIVSLAAGGVTLLQLRETTELP